MAKASLPQWDLRDFYSSPRDPKISADLSSGAKKAHQFVRTYKGKLFRTSISARFLATALKDLERILERSARPAEYAHLIFQADASAENSAFAQRMEEEFAAITRKLIFVDVELIRIPPRAFNALVKNSQLAEYAHYLRRVYAFRPHILSEAEEYILHQKQLTSSGAFSRLFTERVAGFSSTLEHGKRTEQLNESQILALLYHKDRAVRQKAAQSFTKTLQQESRLQTFIFNAIVLDKSLDDEFRHYPSPEAYRHLENELSQQAVDVLIDTVVRNYSLVARFYALKKKQLGIAELTDYDRYAPLPTGNDATIPFDRAQKTVQDTYAAFSPEAEKIIAQFFDRHWIDAELRPNKRGGAFCAGISPALHPYVLVNYTGTHNDIMTLAHELGHGLHFHLARRQNYFNYNMPLVLAETASVFGEMMAFDHMFKNEKRPAAQEALLTSKIESIIATVFRQVAMFIFERELHTERKEKGELSTAAINALWIATQKKMFGKSVTLTEDYRWWWSYIPHFIHTPFYVYAYAFGELLTLALYQRYQNKTITDFPKKYFALLSAGGSQDPAKLLHQTLGVNINDPEFWQEGMRVIADMITTAEQLHARKA